MLWQKNFYGGHNMTKETIIRIHRIYSVLLSIVIVIAGLCLIAGCINIYNLGDNPFSREIVAETFQGIAVPVYLCLGMTLLSFLLEAVLSVTDVLPPERKNMGSQKPYPVILRRLYSNKDTEKCEDSVKNQLVSLQKNRKLHIILRTVVLIISSIAFLIYALNGSHFHQTDINGSMIKAMWILIPCLIVSFGYALFTAIHNERLIQKEIELLKQAPAADNVKPKDSANETAAQKKLNTYRLAILFVAVFCFTYGLLTGGTADVLTKAINICTECIGLG